MSIEWEISFEEYLERMQITPASFKENIQLPKINSIKKVIPLRNMTTINAAIPLRKDFLEQILRKITTVDKSARPFKSSEIKLVKADPNHLKIGQKFVYRENYQKLLEEMPKILSNFMISAGICDLGAYMFFGLDNRDNVCLAYYIPSIIEKHQHELVIMDGIHRNYLNRQLGHTLNTILVENIGIPFSCSLHSWDEIQIISLNDKPKEQKERYFDLKPGLFRDLKYLGIDG